MQPISFRLFQDDGVFQRFQFQLRPAKEVPILVDVKHIANIMAKCIKGVLGKRGPMRQSPITYYVVHKVCKGFRNGISKAETVMSSNGFASPKTYCHRNLGWGHGTVKNCTTGAPLFIEPGDGTYLEKGKLSAKVSFLPSLLYGVVNPPNIQICPLWACRRHRRAHMSVLYLDGEVNKTPFAQRDSGLLFVDGICCRTSFFLVCESGPRHQNYSH